MASASRRKLGRKTLESYLDDVDVFNEPKMKLEQYPTSPHIAATVLHCIETSYGDLEGKVIADLGCGCGVLTIGAAMMGAAHVIGIDIDQDALDICQSNITDIEINNIDLVQADVTKLSSKLPCKNDKTNNTVVRKCSSIGCFQGEMFDTVIMNPPFGTKFDEGIDMMFVQVALNIAKTSVYSLHKSTTRQYIEKTAKKWGVKVEILAELRFNLARTMKIHRKDTKDVAVDFIRFSHK